jgi:hypothetical protein
MLLDHPIANQAQIKDPSIASLIPVSGNVSTHASSSHLRSTRNGLRLSEDLIVEAVCTRRQQSRECSVFEPYEIH